MHGTCGRITVNSKMKFKKTDGIFMGGEKTNTENTEYEVKRVSAANVQEFNVLDNFQSFLN